LKLLALAKVMLLNADVAGSALPGRATPRTGSATAWRNGSARTILEVVSKRIGHLPDETDERGRFQQRVSRSSAPITLVTAGCGSGKTVAAYLWAARQQAGKQLWITYPTTGTATEGSEITCTGLMTCGRLGTRAESHRLGPAGSS